MVSTPGGGAPALHMPWTTAALFAKRCAVMLATKTLGTAPFDQGSKKPDARLRQNRVFPWVSEASVGVYLWLQLPSKWQGQDLPCRLKTAGFYAIPISAFNWASASRQFCSSWPGWQPF